ncbi:MAG: hypothetical protein RLY86_2836 [Pseudomonadota bacterium]
MSTELVELLPPDIAQHRSPVGTDVDFTHRFTAAEPGPHVVLNALMHGNELCGAIVLDRLLRAGLRPRRGCLTMTFANVAAFERFDPGAPHASRFVEEDMNRVWGPEVLAGPRDSVELGRARELWPVLAGADLLLDIHSMQHPTDPLLLCGSSPQGRDLALRLGYPGWIVADEGHAAGKRLIDHPRFIGPCLPGDRPGPAAILVECGQHWQAASADVALACTLRFLVLAGTITPADAAAHGPHLEPSSAQPARLVEIVEAVTVEGEDFTFTADYRGMEVIPRAGTLIATDGARQIRTPHDDCILIMPSRRLRPGQTAVRLGRIVG